VKADWFRSWHGAPTDGKWRMIAADVGCKPAEVAALVWALLDHASANDDRGSIAGFNARVYALDSGTDAKTVRDIVAMLADSEVGVTAGDRFLNWDRRQPKREDGSAERAKEWRERKRTQANECDQERTLEERRGEGDSSVVERSTTADPSKAVWDSGKRLLANGGVQPSKAGALLGKWRRDYGDEALIAALGRCQREGAIDPAAFIEGCLRSHRKTRPEAHQPEMVVPC
jgi:hypothetical protein